MKQLHFHREPRAPASAEGAAQVQDVKYEKMKFVKILHEVESQKIQNTVLKSLVVFEFYLIA